MVVHIPGKTVDDMPSLSLTVHELSPKVSIPRIDLDTLLMLTSTAQTQAHPASPASLPR